MEASGLTDLFSFKAGLLKATPKDGSPGTFKIEADLRKGKLVLGRSPSDGTLHLLWKLRPSDSVVEDILCFPDNQTFTKVDTGREDDRVYLLKFNGSSRRFFFWMQEGKDSNDSENCRLLNKYMLDPPANADIDTTDSANPAVPGAAQAAGGLAGLGDDPNALMQFLSQFQGTAGGAGANGRPLEMGDLSSVLQNMNIPQQRSSSNTAAANPTTSQTSSASASTSAENAEGKEDESKSSSNSNDDAEGGENKSDDQGGSANAPQITTEVLAQALTGFQGMMQQNFTTTPPLHEIVDTSVVQELLSDDDVKNELLPLLPDSTQNMQELYHTITSPQLRQALVALSHALSSESFNSIMSNFALNAMDGAIELQRGDGIGAFLTALQAKADRENNGEDDTGENFYN